MIIFNTCSSIYAYFSHMNYLINGRGGWPEELSKYMFILARGGGSVFSQCGQISLCIYQQYNKVHIASI